MVVRPSFDAQAEKNLLKEIHSRLGTEIRVDLLRVDEIPREANGKFRAVKSSVGVATGPSVEGVGE
jgi:ATP phosphoribosyltransferase regulatory subunit HisZ